VFEIVFDVPRNHDEGLPHQKSKKRGDERGADNQTNVPQKFVAHNAFACNFTVEVAFDHIDRISHQLRSEQHKYTSDNGDDQSQEQPALIFCEIFVEVLKLFHTLKTIEN